MSDFFEVVWPLGRTRTPQRQEQSAEVKAAKALDGLNGATIGFAYDYAFRGDEMFEAVKAAVRERGENASYVDYEVFDNIHGLHESETVAAIPGLLAKHRVDTLVVGVGA